MRQARIPLPMFTIDEAQDYVARCDRALRAEPYFDGHLSFAAHACARRVGRLIANNILATFTDGGMPLPATSLATFVTNALIEHDRWMRRRATGADLPVPIMAYGVAFAVTALRNARVKICAIDDAESWEQLARDNSFLAQPPPPGSYAALALGMQNEYESRTLTLRGYALLARSDRDCIATPFGTDDTTAFPMGFGVEMPAGVLVYVASADGVISSQIINCDALPTIGTSVLPELHVPPAEYPPSWPMLGCWDLVFKALSTTG